MNKLQQTIDILSKLISFDTTSSHSNMSLIEYIRDYLADFGIESTLIKNEEGNKANLLATIGVQNRPGIVLSGHTDVVPVEDEGWVSPPFQLCERNERLYGRGTCDMKGFIATVLAMVPEFVKAPLKAPFHLCFSYDEEVGCLGVHSLVDHLATLPFRPSLAIIGEPTNMALINGQKGKIAVSCCVKGSAGHSSEAPLHVNAIEYAARAIVEISDVAKSFEVEGPFDNDFNVTHSTMLTTMIQGGKSANITPDYCQFDFEIRHIPSHPAEQVLGKIKHKIEQTLVPDMQKKSPTSGFEWRTKFANPSMGDATQTEGFQHIKELFPATSGKVSYGTEGGIFYSKGNIPSVICGPGSIQQAHKTNEFVEKEQLQKCLEFLDELVSFNSVEKTPQPSKMKMKMEMDLVEA